MAKKSGTLDLQPVDEQQALDLQPVESSSSDLANQALAGTGITVGEEKPPVPLDLRPEEPAAPAVLPKFSRIASRMKGDRPDGNLPPDGLGVGKTAADVGRVGIQVGSAITKGATAGMVDIAHGQVNAPSPDLLKSALSASIDPMRLGYGSLAADRIVPNKQASTPALNPEGVTYMGDLTKTPGVEGYRADVPIPDSVRMAIIAAATQHGVDPALVEAITPTHLPFGSGAQAAVGEMAGAAVPYTGATKALDLATGVQGVSGVPAVAGEIQSAGVGGVPATMVQLEEVLRRRAITEALRRVAINTAAGTAIGVSEPNPSGAPLSERAASGAAGGLVAGVTGEVLHGISNELKAAEAKGKLKTLGDIDKAIGDYLYAKREIKMPDGSTITVNSREQAEQMAKTLRDEYFKQQGIDLSTAKPSELKKAAKAAETAAASAKERAGAVEVTAEPTAPPKGQPEPPEAAGATAAKPKPEPPQGGPAGALEPVTAEKDVIKAARAAGVEYRGTVKNADGSLSWRFKDKVSGTEPQIGQHEAISAALIKERIEQTQQVARDKTAEEEAGRKSVEEGMRKKETAPVAEAGKPLPEGASSEDFAAREKAIKAAVKASKESGAQHVDQLPYGVEAMRGVHFKSLRDGTGGTVTTVGSDDLVRYQDDEGEDGIVNRKETEEWVVDGHRQVKLDRKTERYVVKAPAATTAATPITKEKEATPERAQAAAAGALTHIGKGAGINVVAREVRDKDGNKLGEMVKNHGGGDEAAILKTAEALTNEMYQRYPEASNINSRMVATDAQGKPKWAVAPNFKSLAEIGTDEARYIHGDTTARSEPVAKPKLAAADEDDDGEKPAREPKFKNKIAAGSTVMLPSGERATVAGHYLPAGEEAPEPHYTLRDEKGKRVLAKESDLTFVSPPPEDAIPKVDRFKAAYLDALTDEVAKHPEDYKYGAKEVPDVVERMVKALTQGSGSIGPAVRKAAKRVGIRATITDIKAFLSEQPAADQAAAPAPEAAAKPEYPFERPLQKENFVEAFRKHFAQVQGREPAPMEVNAALERAKERQWSSVVQARRIANEMKAEADAHTGRYEAPRGPKVIINGVPVGAPAAPGGAKSGDTVVFDKVPNGSYATTGEPYRIDVGKKEVKLTHVASGASTYESFARLRDARYTIQTAPAANADIDLQPYALEPPPSDIGIKQMLESLPEEQRGYGRAVWKALQEKGSPSIHDVHQGFDFEEYLGLNPAEFGLDADSDEVDLLENKLRDLAAENPQSSVQESSKPESKNFDDLHRDEDALTPVDQGIETMAADVYRRLKGGESLGNVTELNKLAEAAFGSSRVSGKWTPKDAFDAMEAGVNQYLLDQGDEIMRMPVEAGLTRLRELMPRLTTQGTRTDEQINNQQFSTPPTQAFVVAKLADIKPTDVVLEPSAGNGGIALWAQSVGAETHVNEIAPRRQQILRWLGFNEPSAHDGELINALLDPAVKPTVVVMNPPFSASTQKSYEAKNRAQYGFNHVDQALQRLEPNGRLVAILGGGRDGFPNEGAGFDGAGKEWFERIAAKYNIRANVRISGKEYQKYGTTYATRIIVIDKDGPTPSRAGVDKSWASVVQGKFDTLEEAYNALRDVAESRPSLARPGGREGTGQAIAGSGVAAPDRQGDRGDRGAISGSERPGAEVRPADRPGGLAGESGGVGPGARVEPHHVREPGSGSAALGQAPAAPRPGVRAEATEQRPLSKRGGLELEREARPTKAEEEDSTAYVKYKPTLKGPEHPGAIVETKTMSTVPMPEITYRPDLPESIFTEGRMSAVQLEAVAIAGMQNSIVLPDGAYASALVGDGTGVGKGRIAAGILLDNWRQGRKRLVWVSEKWDLMEDALRDIKGLGADELAKTVKAFQKFSATAPINHEGVMFTTYALLRAADKKGNKRVTQLEEWLRGEDNAEGGYMVWDEAHNLKNAVPGVMGEASQIGKTAKDLLHRNPKLRITSLSATAATDVINLGYLDRLGLWGPGTPFPNGFQEFAAQIAGGGLSAMEMIARELKAQGKYVSRTLSFHGVKYREAEHKLTAEQKEVYRTAAKAWRSVLEHVETSIAETTNGGTASRARFLSLFYSAQQRFFNLLITTLKLPTAVTEAKQALAEGKSVVITLVNTNEAAQNREKLKRTDEDSADEPPDYDFGPKEMLVQLVRDHYPVQQFSDDVDENNRPVKKPMYTVDASGNEIPLINPEAVKERDALVDKLNRELHMPANPLDLLIEQMGGPSKVAELTGRKERYDAAAGKFVPRGGPDVKRDAVNLTEMRSFQAGKKRVAVLSSAGGTGISLHAGNDVKNQQPRRHITLQVGWSADKQMQMFGRTHRTNQAHAPEYVLLTSDLGGEKRFVSTIARRLGSLGAISKGQSTANVGSDMMEKVNFETDQGRAAANAFYTALERNNPVPGTDLTGMQVLQDLKVMKQDPQTKRWAVPLKDKTNVTRLLNRLLSLDPDVQNAVYDYYYDIFQATVQAAVEDGTLDTGVRTLPGDEAHIKEQRVISRDPKTGAETFYYPVESHVRTDRMPVKELDRRIKDHAPRNPRIMRHKETGDLALVEDAPPTVHASGATEPAVYVARPDQGRFQKTPVQSFQTWQQNWQPVDEWAEGRLEEAKRVLARAESEAKYAAELPARYPENDYYKTRAEESQARHATAKKEVADLEGAHKDIDRWVREEWERKYEAAPTHRSVEHHLVGGAVMRWWNPIREASPSKLDIYTAVDQTSKQRVVGVEVPPDQIARFLERVTGEKGIVNAHQITADVVKNGMSYSLEGGISVSRGRVARNYVVQLTPPTEGIANQLKKMGVVYERGVMPMYYVPAGELGHEVLDKVLEQYPVKGDNQPPPPADEGGDPNDSMAAVPRRQTAKAPTLATGTQAFKQWFGDSKVVDAQGKPLVVYHGTTKQGLDRFTRRGGMTGHFGSAEQANSRLGQRAEDEAMEGGRTWRGERVLDWDYSPIIEHSNVLPVYLAIRNPLRMSDVHFDEAITMLEDLVERKVFSKAEAKYLQPTFSIHDRKPQESVKLRRIVDALRKKGYDGIVYANKLEGSGDDTWIPFDAAQVKSAIANRGSFDANDPDILSAMPRTPRPATIEKRLRENYRVVPAEKADPFHARFILSNGDVVADSIADEWEHISMANQVVSKEETPPQGNAIDTILNAGVLRIGIDKDAVVEGNTPPTDAQLRSLATLAGKGRTFHWDFPKQREWGEGGIGDFRRALDRAFSAMPQRFEFGSFEEPKPSWTSVNRRPYETKPADLAYSYTPATGDTPIVWLNEVGRDLIQEASQGRRQAGWVGNSMSKDLTGAIADRLLDGAQAEGDKLSDADRDAIRRLAGAVNSATLDADEGGVAFVVRTGNKARDIQVARHELTHAWQRRRGYTRGAYFGQLERVMMNHPVTDKALVALEENGYDVHNPIQVTAELMAYISAGDWESVGLDLDEAVDWLATAYESLAEFHGLDILGEIENLRAGKDDVLHDAAMTVLKFVRNLRQERDTTLQKELDDARSELATASRPDAGPDRLPEAGGEHAHPDQGLPQRPDAGGAPQEPQPSPGKDQGRADSLAAMPAGGGGGSRRPPAQAVTHFLGDEAAKNRQARWLQEGIYDLEAMDSADRLRAAKLLEIAPGSKADRAQVYHHLENPKVLLSAAQQRLLDRYVNPLMQESQRIFDKLKGRDPEQPLEDGSGIPLKPGYVHRVARDKGNAFDRILAGVKARVAGSSLSKSASALKGRTYKSIENENGQRLVVTMDHGAVTAWVGERPMGMGPVQMVPDKSGEGELFKDKNGETWRFGEATTREIEANTPTRYFHDALASALESYLSLRRVERASDFLEGFKTSPEFRSIALAQGAGNPPKGWQPARLPQFRNYYFEPHTREVLDWYADQLQTEGPGVLERIGRFLRTAIFFNPLIHTPNIAVHFAVEKGATGLTSPVRSLKAAARAINAVIHQNQDYLDALDVGAPLTSHRAATEKLNEMLFAKLADELEADETGTAVKIAKAVGMSVPNLIKAIYRFSGAVTWVSNDVAFLQSTYEKTERGMPLREALKETAKHIPDYRLPTRILDSRTLGRIMGSPLMTMFGAYHYGALKSYGEMAKSATGLQPPIPEPIAEVQPKSERLDALLRQGGGGGADKPPSDGGGAGAEEPADDHIPAGEGNEYVPPSKGKEAAHGLELLAVLGLFTFGLYPLIDKYLRQVSGEKTAELRRAGATTVPYNLYLLARGERSPTDVATSILTPSIGSLAAAEMFFNRDVRTGRRIYDTHADNATIGAQVARRGLGYLAPFGEANKLYEDDTYLKKFLYGLGGVRFPKHGAERIAADIASERMTVAAPTADDLKRWRTKRNALEAARGGDFEPLVKAVNDGIIPEREARQIKKDASRDPLVVQTEDFTLEEFMRVWRVATEEQKAVLAPELNKKIQNAGKAGNRQEAEKVYSEAFGR